MSSGSVPSIATEWTHSLWSCPISFDVPATTIARPIGRAFTLVITYKIVRFYAPHLEQSNRVIRRGLTLQAAQSWCRSPDTRKAGEWFDGYDEE